MVGTRAEIPPSGVSDASLQRTIPMHIPPSNIVPATQGDPMDITPMNGNGAMGPPYLHNLSQTAAATESMSNVSLGQSTATPAASQHPKVVQTAFIHKLYNMLEDQNIQHLINWSSSHDSFVISPTPDFARVLATYFKHTNVSSFVRQLNMYGFHKVSDVFHTGAPEAPLWEFKHGTGSFRRGDFAGLKEIKRRPSRHTLIHRDSFPSNPRPLPMAMGPPMEPPPDTVEGRVGLLEHTLYDVHGRLARAEEANAFMAHKCQSLMENLLKCYQYNHDLSSFLLRGMADADGPMHREIINMQLDISRQLDGLRNTDNVNHMDARLRQHSFAQPQFENGAPMSPFQLAQDDQRRGSLFNTRPGFFRPPMPHRSVTTESPRRFEQTSTRPPSPPAPPMNLPAFGPPIAPTPDPTPATESPPLSPPAYLSRRHTSADIHADTTRQDWTSTANSNEHLPLPHQLQHSPYASGQSSANWPSSPHRAPNATNLGEQQLRDTLARYQLSSNDGARLPTSSSSSLQPLQSHAPRQPSPPPLHEAANGHAMSGRDGIGGPGGGEVGGWSYAGGPRLPFKDVFGSSGPPTRRGSVAHLLNPAETAERSDEDDVGPDELRKRKRLG